MYNLCHYFQSNEIINIISSLRSEQQLNIIKKKDSFVYKKSKS